MNQPMSLERMVTSWMADAAATTAPSEQQLIDQILTATAQQRPRPRWLALLQESPMQAQARVVVGSPNRRLLIAATLLLIAALAAVGIGAFLQQAKPTASDDWPGFRGGAGHAGVVTHGPTGNAVVAWKATVGAPVRGDVAILDDLAFVGSDDGVLTALSTADGVKRWSFSAPAPMGGPHVTGGVVYAVDGQGVVHAVKASDGTPIWASTVRIPNAADGVVSDGLLYYASPDGAVLALHIHDGTQAWRTAVSPTPITMRAPTVDAGMVVAVDIQGFLTALDARTGQIRWADQQPVNTPGTPVIADGTVYEGGAADATTGSLVALDASDGTVRWRVDRPLSSPVTFGSTGYVTGHDGTIAAIDLTTGKSLWEARFPAGEMRSPVVTDAVVYGYTDTTHRVIALDRASGGLLWTVDLDGSDQCCLAASRGKLYVATDAGTVYAIGGDGARLTVGSIPQAAPSTAPTTAPTMALPADLHPKLDWIADSGPEDFVPWSLAKAPDGRIWAALGLTDRFAIFGPDGHYEETWGTSGNGKGQFNLRRANGDPFGMLAFAKDGSFYVLDAGNHRIQVFDKDRKYVRTWGTLGKGPGQFTETAGIAVDGDGNVVVLDNIRAVIETYKPDGTVLSAIPAFPAELHVATGVNKGANQVHIGPNGHYFLSVVDSATEPNVVAEIDGQGALIRTYGGAGSPCALHEQPNGVAWDASGRMYVGQGPQRGDAPGVLVFGRDGSCLGGFGPEGTGDTDLGFVWSVLVDESGIYVSDAGGVPDVGLRSAIRKFEPLPPLAP